ncbi:MAG: hypothetical protein ABSH48_16325 [Verrucomicrobiota bacterium]
MNLSLQKFIVPHTKSQSATKVKTVMGKQYNKAQNKQRRKAYIKRRKTTLKAKRAGGAEKTAAKA